MAFNLPEPVVEIIKDAYASVIADPQHVLAWEHRLRLWRYMGPRRIPAEPPSVAHERRTRLAVECVQKVLPVWSTYWPGNDAPLKALRAVPDALRDWANPDPYFAIMRDVMEQVEEAMADVFWASRAGHSAAEALVVAIGDEQFKDEGEMDEGDAQTDGPNQDAAGNAAVAFARGTTLHADSDPAARLEFWRWYLEEAVPRVFDSHPLKLRAGNPSEN
jgi:hypothetical protein